MITNIFLTNLVLFCFMVLLMGIIKYPPKTVLPDGVIIVVGSYYLITLLSVPTYIIYRIWS